MVEAERFEKKLEAFVDERILKVRLKNHHRDENVVMMIRHYTHPTSETLTMKTKIMIYGKSSQIS